MSTVYKANEVFLLKDSKDPEEKQNHHPSTKLFVKEEVSVVTQIGGSTSISSSGNNIAMDHDEKRMRRQIANSNERRRMQSINAGFQSLRNLLPHHEGEKLSKASILQQTAEYIYNLEQEKTRLLSQNCHLKRLIDQHDGAAATSGQEANQPISLPKKRKLEGGIVVQAISDSSDEGLGSMSPEPVPVSFVTVVSSNSSGTTTTKQASHIQISAKDFIEMKHQLEQERRQKLQLEEQLRQLETQTYQDRTIHYQEVIEHTDSLRDSDEILVDPPLTKVSLQHLKQLQAQGNVEDVLLTLDSIPSVGQTQVVVCSPVGELVEENSRPISPSDLMTPDDIKQEKIIITTTEKRPHLPQTRMSSILEAAIKAEPKVEVERIDAPSTIVIDDSKARVSSASQSRMYLTNTSRQNLETIVEAIRHLEGDHLFEEVIEQDAPLALTTKQVREQREREHRKIQLEINPFLKFNTNTSSTAGSAVTTSAVTVIPATAISTGGNHQTKVSIQQQQINRPGVIVVKQNS